MYKHKPGLAPLALGAGYSPSMGRWLSRDPIGEAGGLNLYGYCNNNPISNIDPLGLCYSTKTKKPVFTNKGRVGTTASIDLPMNFSGPGATPANKDAIKNGIEKNWSGQFGNVNLTTTVNVTGPGPQVNNIYLPAQGTEPRTFVGGSANRSQPDGTWPINKLNAPENGDMGWASAHETGHLLGLGEGYTQQGTGPFGMAPYVRQPNTGMGNDIMGDAPFTPPSAGDVKYILSQP